MQTHALQTLQSSLEELSAMLQERQPNYKDAPVRINPFPLNTAIFIIYMCVTSRTALKERTTMSNNDEELLCKAYDLAFKYEANYGSCPQCVLRALHEVFCFKMDEVIKSSHPLAGGTALSGEGTCGALLGGIMAIGFMHGRELKDMDKGRFLKSYTLAKRLYDRFVKEFGSCLCKEVQKKIFGRSFNLWDSEDFKEFERMGGHRDKCPDVSGKVARWAAEILFEEMNKTKGTKHE